MTFFSHHDLHFIISIKDDVGAQSVYFRLKHKAAEIGREAKPILREAWSDSRDIEAGDKYARLTKQRYEASPNQVRCLSAHEAFASTAKHIGMGVTTLTSVNKSELLQSQKQCLSDLKLVIGLTDQKIKEVIKVCMEMFTLTGCNSTLTNTAILYQEK